MGNVILNLIVIRTANLETSVKFYRMLGLDFVKHTEKDLDCLRQVLFLIDLFRRRFQLWRTSQSLITAIFSLFHNISVQPPFSSRCALHFPRRSGFSEGTSMKRG